MQQNLEKTQQMVDQLTQINQILEANHYDKTRLIPILQQVQALYKYLSVDNIRYVATSLGVPPAYVYGVATFYAAFNLAPQGKHIIRICDGTACHVKKARGILDALYQKLNLNPEKHTTDDLQFTIELVNCVGACGLAPVVVLDGEVHGQVTPEAAVALIDKVIAADAAEQA